ncbi:MAG: polyhydroxyalkanoate synthesis regulator DNA-binding domain-containing protein [Deltaproteobacteria bacterium]|nr:polyhydroxyalkanoate synthesis regulator DNA-binding domain-containing protein [Deltaproteobacteria bacterium]MCW5806438.1 polyhydroxyalkanoate synthesis regulator DNA-binding domain-containing protein [Deltaproteobacteria bacterium]
MAGDPMPETRIIKRYANRKLYDTEHSRYVTLDQISEMIRNGDDVKIVDNKTKEDLTTVTLAQIIFEEEKKQRSFLPLGAMRNIIQSGGAWFAEAQRRVQSILPGKRHDAEAPPDDDDASSVDEAMVKKRSLASLREWIEHSKHRLDEWQKQVDSKIRSTIDGISHAVTPWASVNKDVRALADRIADLEAKLHELEAHEEPRTSALPAGDGTAEADKPS